MKYRIIEKKEEMFSSETVFIPQEKCKFWPFWVSIGHSFATLKEAEAYIKALKKFLTFKTVIHEFNEKEKNNIIFFF